MVLDDKNSYMYTNALITLMRENLSYLFPYHHLLWVLIREENLFGISKVSNYVFFDTCFWYTSVLLTPDLSIFESSVDPDQMASDQDPPCFPL